jgi:hypothetical protein
VAAYFVSQCLTTPPTFGTNDLAGGTGGATGLAAAIAFNAAAVALPGSNRTAVAAAALTGVAVFVATGWSSGLRDCRATGHRRNSCCSRRLGGRSGLRDRRATGHRRNSCCSRRLGGGSGLRDCRATGHRRNSCRSRRLGGRFLSCLCFSARYLGSTILDWLVNKESIFCCRMAVSAVIAFAGTDPSTGGTGATGFASLTLACARAVRCWLTLANASV